jgi:type IV secretory pathway component VirB8
MENERFDFDKMLSNGMSWRRYVQSMRAAYDQPAVEYLRKRTAGRY